MDIKYGRKRKGIIKELNKKLKNWMDSISDESVKSLVERDAIVMGGSIASMLLGESVNDYDIYFKSKETAKAVAEYYVDWFNKNNKLETEDDVKPYEPFVKEDTITNIKGVEEDRVVIYIRSAGVAGENPEKYDYFEQEGSGDQEEFIDSCLTHDEKGGNYRPVFLSQNAITLTNKIQIVIRFFGEPDKVLESYDFVHAMNYFDYKKQELNLTVDAMESLMSRTLVYKGSLYPISSIWRMKKFLSRGWRISAGQQLKIMWQISEVNMKDMDTVREQLTGVDAAYLYQLIKALESMENFDEVDSTYISTMIDRIFED